MARNILTKEDFNKINNKKELLKLIEEKKIAIQKTLDTIEYEDTLIGLQKELVKLQSWIFETNARVAIIFEGRDAAGKGGTIRRFIEHLNPRTMRVVALDNPTMIEKG